MDHFGAFFGDVPSAQGDVVRLGRAGGVGGMLLHHGSHVGGELDHFAQAPAGVVHRVVVGFEPHGLAVLIHPFELAAEHFALIQALPEVAVGRAAGHGRAAEHAVMLALDLRQGVTHALQEIGVGRDDGAVEVELDHRHGAADSGQFGISFAFSLQARRDVHGVLHHFGDLTCFVTYRVVAGLQPNRLAIARHPFKGAGLELAITQVRPQLVVLGAAGECGGAEHTMGLALDLLGAIAHGLEEVVIGPQHSAGQVEFDHRHGPLDGIQQAGLLGDGVLQGIDGFFMGVE